MSAVRWFRTRTFVYALVLLTVSGLAGSGAAWFLSGGDPEPPVGVRKAEAQAAYAPDGHYLGDAQDYDPAVSFPVALSKLPFPPADLLADAGGELWIPLFTGGDTGHKLYRYDPAKDHLRSYDLPDSPGSGLFSAIARAPNGHVVLAYGYLVLDFDPSSGSYRRHDLPQPPPSFAKLGVETGTWVTDMAVDGGGVAYVARMNNAAITELDMESGKMVELPVPEAFGAVAELELGSEGVYISNWFGSPGVQRQVAAVSRAGQFTSVADEASGLAAGTDGAVYAATADRELASLSGRQPSPISGPDIAASLTGMKDYVAVDAGRDAIWLAGRDLGTLARYNRADGKLRVYLLPAYVIPASRISCPVGIPCPDVTSTTRVDGLAVAPSGGLYFSDATMNRVGFIKGGQ